MIIITTKVVIMYIYIYGSFQLSFCMVFYGIVALFQGPQLTHTQVAMLFRLYSIKLYYIILLLY